MVNQLKFCKPVFLKQAIIPFVFACVGLLFSCNQNRMKTDEKTLTQKILTEEEKLAEEAKQRAEQEKQMADSLSKLPKGFRFEEERAVDPEKPPIVINFAESLNNVSDLKLSDFAKDIKYIRLEPIPDNALSCKFKYKYYMMDNYLVALNLYGIHLFTKEGKYIRSVVRNQLTGVTYNEQDNILIIKWDNKMIGGGLSVWARGDRLFYTYQNKITDQSVIMEYDCTKEQIETNYRFDPENPQKIIGLGDILIDLKHGKASPPPPTSPLIIGANGGTPEEFYKKLDFFSPLGFFTPDRNTYVTKRSNKNLLAILGKNGDTLATFVKHEQLKNFTKIFKRYTDQDLEYEKGGNLFIRSKYNDTIFQVIPPNRLLPVYVLNLGKYKTTIQEGFDPDVSLEGKIIPGDWAETHNYIYLTFTKDSRNSPKNRRNKSVKIYHAIFTKSSQKLQIVKADPYDYEAPVLINDIDGGYPVWPLSYQVSNNDEILISLKGNELKEFVKTIWFKNSTASINKKEKLNKFANTVKNDDDILMVVK